MSHEIGRPVKIGTLRLTLGRVTKIDLNKVTVANLAGASDAPMIRLAHLKAEMPLWSLISGSPIIQKLSIESADVVLEHGTGDRPNWHFKTAAMASKRPNRVELPVMLDAHFKDITIDFRGLSGASRTVVEDGTVRTVAAGKPVSLNLSGRYNDMPLDLTAALSSFAALHDASVPFPAKITIKDGPTRIDFDGTFTDPLDIDGADGDLTLVAPSLPGLAQIAGVGDAPDIAMTLSGHFIHQGGLWRLSSGIGAVAAQTFKDAMLELREGTQQQPDAIAVSAAFDTLNLNDALKRDASAAASRTNLSLLQDPAPGILLDAWITAAHVVYGAVAGDDFGLKAKTGAGTLTVEDFTLGVAGGTAKSKISIANKDGKAVVNFDGALTGVDVAQLNTILGWRSTPLGGALTSRVIGSMIGVDLAEARRTNRIFAVAAMEGGTIDRDLVRMAATDIRALFGSEPGNRPLICMLLVANLRDGTGTIAPFRIKTSSGVIAGSGTYNTLRDTIDLTIGAQSKSWLKLDVPMRVTGPVSNFSAQPAFGAASRVLSNVGLPDDFPQALKDMAAPNSCLRP